MGTNKLALVLAFLFVGCGLDTNGQSLDGDDFGSDIELDEVEPAVPEADAAEDSELEDATPDETVEDVPEADAAEDSELEDEATDEADDGGVVDPCERPDIPETGIYAFFCFADDIRADMILSLQIERGGLPIFPWAEILDCTATGARSMFCELPLYYNAVYFFNIEIPGVGIGWSCGPGTDVLWGAPRIWVNHAEQTVRVVPNIDGGCNHQFTTPPSGPL
jgi:hypothetical protein